MLTILHTNDLHAHDEPFEEYGRKVGGLARIGYLIRAIRKDTPNVLAIDAGDIFQGTTFYKLYHGEVEVQLLNQAGYDIYTIGNHEFDNGPDEDGGKLQPDAFKRSRKRAIYLAHDPRRDLENDFQKGFDDHELKSQNGQFKRVE